MLANVGLLMWGLWYHKPLVDVDPIKPRPTVAQDKMKLLSEPGARLVLRSADGASAAAPNGASANCFQLGTFPTLEKVRTAAGKLDIWGLRYTRVAEFETLGPSYRVYLPPLPSRDEAERKRRELTKLGFTDHAVIQQEEGMENAISLGIFSVEQNAITRAQQLARQNIHALIQPIPNVHPVYWLALSTPAVDGRIGATPLSRFAEEDWGVPNVGLRPALCGVERAAQ
jgi:SPOR domain